MGQNKGCIKPRGSGRKAGTPNKRSEYFGVADRLYQLGYDLIEKLVQDIAILDTPRDRVRAHLELLEYCDARRKTIETNQEIVQVLPIVQFGVRTEDIVG